MHLNDFDSAKSTAVEKRIRSLGGAPICYNDPADVAVDKIVAAVNPGGLHFAFLDPYNLEGLSFAIIRKLAKLQRVDMLIHVSVQDLQRNLDDYSRAGGVFDSFAPGWHNQVNRQQAIKPFRAALMEYWLAEIRKLGNHASKRRRTHRRFETAAALLAGLRKCARSCAKAMGSDSRPHETDNDGFRWLILQSNGPMRLGIQLLVAPSFHPVVRIAMPCGWRLGSMQWA
jgi:three-Cys-motif partner protein